MASVVETEVNDSVPLSSLEGVGHSGVTSLVFAGALVLIKGERC